LYNSLLDDLEDDVTPGPDDAAELVDKVVDDVDAVDDDLLAAESAAGDIDAEVGGRVAAAERADPLDRRRPEGR